MNHIENSGGFVLLTAIQLTGAAIALAGLILVFTAIFLALRWRPEQERRPAELWGLVALLA
jgi:hypothetical protein